MADDNDDQDQGNQQLSPDQLKDLRSAAKRSNENKLAADAAQRELAFVKAGFDTDHPLVASLMATYNGEMTRDAVRAHMEALQVPNLLNPAPAGGEETPPKPDTTATAEERAQTHERMGAIDGGEAPTSNAGEDPKRAGLNEAFDIIESGGTREDGAAAFFSKVFGAAIEGDQRVLTSNKGGGYLPS